MRAKHPRAERIWKPYELDERQRKHPACSVEASAKTEPIDPTSPENAASLTSSITRTKDIMKEHQQEQPSAKPMPVPITLADIQRAKAVLAQAEAALGVAKAKAAEAPIPLHPQSLEDPAQGDKTLAVVEWYRDNEPDEYNRRYAGRKTHLEDRRKERPRLVATDREQNANEASRRSLGIVGSDTNLNMPGGGVETPVPNQKSEVPLLHQGAISNKDKRRHVEAALRANPAKRNREIARETGTTHPFVAKTRRRLETLPRQERGRNANS